MTASDYPDALLAVEVAPNKTRSVYPEPFASMMDRREKRLLGDMFDLSNFGVNLTHTNPVACQLCIMRIPNRMNSFMCWRDVLPYYRRIE